MVFVALTLILSNSLKRIHSPSHTIEQLYSVLKLVHLKHNQELFVFVQFFCITERFSIGKLISRIKQHFLFVYVYIYFVIVVKLARYHHFNSYCSVENSIVFTKLLLLLFLESGEKKNDNNMQTILSLLHQRCYLKLIYIQTICSNKHGN